MLAKLKRYNLNDIRFDYPDHWTLDDEEQTERGKSVAVYAPSGAFWLVTKQEGDDDLQAIADEALSAMRDEYDDVEAEPVEEKLAGCKLLGYNLSFVFLDLPCTSLIRCATSAGSTYLILCESEDSDFDDLESTFQTITASLLKKK